MFEQKRRIYSLTFKSIAALIVLAGIIHNMIDPWGSSEGLYGIAVFMYYTLLSNALVLGVFVALIVRDINILIKLKKNIEVQIPKRCLLYVIQAGTVVSIMLTFLVFWGLLAPPVFMGDDVISLLYFNNLSTHLLAAIFMTVDYFVFTPRGHLKFNDIWWFTIFPIFYLVFATIGGFAGVVYRIHADGYAVRFPYGFMDYDRTGWLVIPWFIGIAVVFIGMSLLIYWLDKRLNKIEEINKQSIS